ncbi:MAG: beta-lactamase family protein [Spirochaetales bacterium]|nr:beta-lactamase family protein [Spirochaetales bacterium]
MIYEGTIDTTPEGAGYSPEVIGRLDSHFCRLIDEKKIQCAGYLMARSGKIFAKKSMGKLSGIADKGDFKPDSIRKIASITKVFTATAIHILLEEGKLCIHQRVSEIIDEFNTDMHKDITIFQLLTHTSGLPSDPGTFLEPYPPPYFSSDTTRKNWIKKYLSGPLQYPPGTVWNYSTKGFMVLGEIIARISGVSYPDYIESNILKPLGMNNTFFVVPPEKRDTVCVVEKSEWEWLNREEKEEDKENGTPSWYAGGGLYSTLGDLYRFGRMILDRGILDGTRILGKNTVEAATRNYLKNIPCYNWGSGEKDKHYGLGWEVDKEPLLPPGVIDHEGSGGASLFIDVANDFIMIHFAVFSDNTWIDHAMYGTRVIGWSGLE